MQSNNRHHHHHNHNPAEPVARRGRFGPEDERFEQIDGPRPGCRHHDQFDPDADGPHRGRRRGPRPYGPPFGPGGPRDFGGRRRRGDVGIALLMVLEAEGPRNGYQMMQSLQERSQGGWRPSPGSVYPALAQLEDRGLVTSKAVEGESGNSYELTDAGRELLAERGDRPAPWESGDGADDTRAELLKSVHSTMQAARQLAREGDEAHIAKATALFTELRRELYRILAGDTE